MEEILDERRRVGQLKVIMHFGQKKSENETDLSYAGEKLSKFVVVVRSSELGWDR